MAGTPYIYVCNFGGQSISVIDPTTLAVITTITLPVGATPRNAFLDPTGSFLYICDQSSSDDLQVVDAGANTFLTSVSLSATPVNLRLAALGLSLTTCYIVGSGTASLPSTSGVVMVDIATNTVTGNIPLPNYYSAEAFVTVTPDNNWVYVAYNASAGNIIVCIDANTNTIADTYTDTFGQVTDICSDSSSSTVYAIDSVLNRVYVISAGSAHPSSTISVGHSTTGYIGIDKADAFVYVPCTDQNIWVPATGALTSTTQATPAGSAPYYVVPPKTTSPNTYVTDSSSGGYLYKFQAGALVSTISTPGETLSGALAPNGATVFVAATSLAEVPVYDTTTDANLATPLVGNQPTFVVSANYTPAPPSPWVLGAVQFG